MQERRIGIMGGTFNPVHYAHLHLAECAREEYSLDRVIFIPTGTPYFKVKDNPSAIPPGELRYQLIKRAIRDNPYFTCSRIEIDRPGNTYTADTLAELQTMYPGDSLYFILGADALFEITEWARIDEIFSRATLLAAVRGDKDIDDIRVRANDLKENYGARVELLSLGRMDISSSDIRDRIRQGRSVRYLLPESCVRFLTAKSFYSEHGAVDDINTAADKIYIPKHK